MPPKARALTCDPRVERSLFSWRSYALVLFVIAGAIVITLAFLFQDEGLLDLVPTSRLIWTIVNIFGISALLTLAAGLYHRHTVQRPVEQVLSFTKAMSEGEFSARIPERSGPLRNEFDVMVSDLNGMAAELGSVEALRSDFVASVSHEMKTPLAVISNYTTIMQDPSLSDEERCAYARKCGDAARRLSGMVADILRLNKLENQAIFPELVAFDLSEHLAECLIGFEEALGTAGLELEVELDEDVTMEGDAELLALVWNNLIGNAIKFSEPGGCVSVRMSAHDGWATVVVTDEGCGIAAEDQRRIFDKFYQADDSHSVQGNGLGLALVRRVVDLHGGTVAVESALGQGSAFTVRLPLAVAQQER